jgi:LuxR family maltose regulon positive regulatory protein
VERPRLTRRLANATAPVVLLVAPSGYGKSVLLRQWAESDPRAFVSIILGDEHNDPAMLLASVIGALDTVEPVSSEVAAALAAPDPNIDGVVLPRLARALAERRVPQVLVLDELENVESQESLHAVSTVGSHLARDSQLALATRTEPALPIGRLRASRGLTELGRAELMMTKVESNGLLTGLGLELAPTQLDTLVRHTEGWPAALYLAGLALRDEPDLGDAIGRFAGDDRIVVDYLREEFLAPVSRRRLEFLRQVSILDRVSGSLCDAVVGRTGSAAVLCELSRSNALLMPLDRRDEWFRFHPLFREMLNAELQRVDPGSEPGLHSRASDWWMDHGDTDRAIQHAIEGEDFERAGELLFLGVPEYMARGRIATVMRWLDRMGEDEAASDPALSLTTAYARITLGLGAEAEHWAAVSAGLLDRMAPSPKKQVLMSGLALVGSALARRGVKAMSDGTAVARELLTDDSPWMSMCCLIDGVSAHLRALREQARDFLLEGARRGAVGAPSVQVLCLAQLALIAVDEDDWQLAETLAAQARAQIERSGLDETPLIAFGVAVSAYVRSHRGRIESAAADVRLATRLLGKLDDFAPWYEAEIRIVLAHASARLDDATSATAMLEDAGRFVRQAPDAVVLGEWIEQVVAEIETVSSSAAEDLTPAELRVVDYLPTHLSFPQIAAQIFLSPNTVKTQAQSVYRKLGVSSRRDAVEQAREAGLLDRDDSVDSSGS